MLVIKIKKRKLNSLGGSKLFTGDLYQLHDKMDCWNSLYLWSINRFTELAEHWGSACWSRWLNWWKHTPHAFEEPQTKSSQCRSTIAQPRNCAEQWSLDGWWVGEGLELRSGPRRGSCPLPLLTWLPHWSSNFKETDMLKQDASNNSGYGTQHAKYSSRECVSVLMSRSETQPQCLHGQLGWITSWSNQ